MIELTTQGSAKLLGIPEQYYTEETLQGLYREIADLNEAMNAMDDQDAEVWWQALGRYNELCELRDRRERELNL